MGLVRVRRVAAVFVIVLGFGTSWAMQPGKQAAASRPAGNVDLEKMAAAIRQAPANYAAAKVQGVAATPKRKRERGPLGAAKVGQAIVKAMAAGPSGPVEALRATRPDLQVQFDRRSGAAISIKGSNLRAPDRLQGLSRVGVADPAFVATAAAQDGLDTLQEYRGLLKIHDARQEFVQKTSETDSLGLTHVKYQQVFNGLPVWNKQVWVHLDRQGASYLVEGRIKPTPSVTTQPQLTAQQAIDKATADLGEARNPTAELVVHVDGMDIARLAWHVTAYRTFERFHLFISAATGAVLQRVSDTRYEAAGGSGVDLLNHTDLFSTWYQGGSYYLIDTSLHGSGGTDPLPPNELGTSNLIVFDGQKQNPDSNMTAYFFTSSSPATGWDTTGVSTLNNFRLITQYYKNTHNRNGIDGKTLNSIAFVHVGDKWDNAAWTGQVIMLGDGRDFLSLARGLDVLAHEYTHGVIEYSANFEYEFQSGALHEAFADIMAAMIDRDDWKMGEDVVRSGPPFRDLADPHASMDWSPATMDEYQNLSWNDDLGGVHVNATIPGHAAYLMAEGLGNAIGREKVERIFYRALTVHMTSQSDFSDCRRATVQSAQELYGVESAEAKAASDAWDAVKVVASSGGPGDGGNQIPPAEGPDNQVYIEHDPNGNAQLMMLDSNGNSYYVSGTPVSNTRVVVTTGGTEVLFVDWHHNLRIASLSIYNTYEERLTYDGSVRTICGSVDGRYFAYTDTSNDNNLHVLDLVDSSKNKTYALYMPSIDGGDTTSLLEYADVMDFDISNAHVIFDALSNFQLGSTAYEFWSVGILDIGTGNVSNLISAQPSGVDIGNPSASSTQDWIIAVDVIDNNTGMCETRVVNLQTGKSGLVGEQLFVEQPGAESLNDGLGWPTFNGDGTYVALQYKQPGEVEASVIKVPISADSDGTVAGDFSHAESIEYNAYRPRYYRSGQSGGQAHIVVSSNTLDFGSVLVGSSAQRLVTVGNTGSYPLMITGYALSDSVQFMHDGGPIEISAGYEMDVSVVFTPAGEGAQSAVLTIQSDDPEVPEVQVNLAGQAYTDGSAGGGGNTRRGCFIATAAYGSYLEPHVMVLRQLRDEHLLTNGPGRAFVAAYYRCSPPIASFIAKHESLRTATRGVLTPVVLVVQYPEPALAIFLAVAGGGLVWRNRRSACRKSRG